MQHALQNVPIAEQTVPPGVSHDSGDWTYTEVSRGGGVSSLGVDGKSGNSELPASDEKKRILDLFKN